MGLLAMIRCHSYHVCVDSFMLEKGKGCDIMMSQTAGGEANNCYISFLTFFHVIKTVHDRSLPREKEFRCPNPTWVTGSDIPLKPQPDGM